MSRKLENEFWATKNEVLRSHWRELTSRVSRETFLDAVFP